MATMASGKKCCIVVGLGRGGIGDNLAMKFSAENYNVAMVARSSLQHLEAKIPNSKGYQCDASDPEQVKATVQAIRNDMGEAIHALMYNAGSGVFKGVADTSYEEFSLSWRTGPAGAFSFVKECLPSMPPGSSVGFTGATASWRGMPVTAAFASSKMALRGLAQALARDLGPTKGIHVFHVIIDGIVNLKQEEDDEKDHDLTLNPDVKQIHPKHIAETYFNLSQQPPDCWTHETHIAPQGVFGSIASI